MPERDRPILRVVPDAEGLAECAAEEFVRVVQAALERSEVARVVLSGGTTPRKLYERLRAPGPSGGIPWNRIHLFWGDERFVSRDDPHSNYGMTRSALLDHVAIPVANVHAVPTPRESGNDPGNAARSYEAEIAAAFDLAGADAPPSFDLVLLGLGADAHTASLFPNAPAVSEPRRWVVPVVEAPKPPRTRISMTPVVLNQASVVLFLVSGNDKAGAVRDVLEGPYDPSRYPAQAIQRGDRGSNERLWLVDRDAARLL